MKSRIMAFAFFLVMILTSLVALQVPEVQASSVVGTSTSSNASGYAMQRKTFYANGRYWVFFYTGSAIVYKTSTDAISWSDSVTVVTQGASYFSVWFDGANLHYVSISPSQYRMGTPNSDGTITWATPIQNPSLTGYQPTVIVDSEGYPWIAWHDGAYPKITKSAYNNGSWSTASGFPYILNSTNDSGWDVHLTPLTGGKIYVVYGTSASDFPLLGKLWNGASWGSAETVNPENPVHGLDHSVVSIGDDVHLLYEDEVHWNVSYRKRTFETSTWESEVKLAWYAYKGVSLSKDSTTDDLYAFWLDTSTDTINYRKLVNSTQTWASERTLITGSVLPYELGFTTFYQTWGSNIGILYTSGASSPYTVKFALAVFNLNLRLKDSSNNVLTSGDVYINDASWRSQTVSADGWANFTVFVEKTASVKAKYQDIWVNGTFTVTMDTDKTVDIVCNVYAQASTLLYTDANTTLGDVAYANDELSWKATGTGSVTFKVESPNPAYYLKINGTMHPEGDHWNQSENVITITDTLASTHSYLLNFQPPSPPSTTKVSITVIVVDSTGIPIYQAKVTVYDMRMFVVASALTDQRGEAEVSLSKGEYLVEASKGLLSGSRYVSLARNTEITVSLGEEEAGWWTQLTKPLEVLGEPVQEIGGVAFGWMWNNFLVVGFGVAGCIVAVHGGREDDETVIAMGGGLLAVATIFAILSFVI